MDDKKADTEHLRLSKNPSTLSDAYGKRRWFAWLTSQRIMAAFTVVSAICAIVALFQIWLLSNANDLSRSQATSLRDANRIASDTAQKQLRAYVAAVQGEVDGVDESGSFRIRITVRNSGQTPAYETSVDEFDVWWQEVKPFFGVKSIPIKEGIQTTLAAGEAVLLEPKEEIAVSPHERSEFLSRRLVLHARGMVSYRDIYGELRASSFHFVQGGEYDPRSRLMGIAREGNASN